MKTCRDARLVRPHSIEEALLLCWERMNRASFFFKVSSLKIICVDIVSSAISSRYPVQILSSVENTRFSGSLGFSYFFDLNLKRVLFCRFWSFMRNDCLIWWGICVILIG